MSVESIKPEIARVIAVACEISSNQALRLVECALDQRTKLPTERTVIVKGLGEVVFKWDESAAVANKGTTQSKTNPLKVAAKFSVGNVTNLITFGGLEGDPPTPPPDFDPIEIKAELRPLLQRRGRIFFDRGGQTYLGKRSPFAHKIPNVTISTSRLSSKKQRLT